MRHRMLMVAALVGLASAAGAQETHQPPTRLPASKVTAEEGKAVMVQNDRHEAIRFYVESGNLDQLVGSVAPNATAQLQLPAWAADRKRSLRMFAVSEATAQLIARYEVSARTGEMIGLLVPPAAGLPRSDSLLITLPRGIGSAATVTIANERSQPVTVFAEQGLRYVRIGEVAANQQGTLPLPKSILSGKDGVRIFARPVGAPARSTQALTLKEGDHISVIVM